MIALVEYALIALGIATIAALVARMFAAPADPPETWP